jgi:hypothetical protein
MHFSSSLSVSTQSLFVGSYRTYSVPWEPEGAGCSIEAVLLGFLLIIIWKFGILGFLVTDFPLATSCCCSCCCVSLASLIVIAAVNMACCLSFQKVNC